VTASSQPSLQVHALSAENDFARYASFADEVYAGDSNFRPHDHQGVIEQISNRSPFAAHSTAQAFWVADGPRILAVVTALVDQSYDTRWNEHGGHLLYYDAAPDAHDATRVLVDEACRWLQNRGAEFARVGFMAGWQLPATIDAYDQVPTIFHSYNAPYYHRFIKSAGFWTEKGLVEYRVRFTQDLAERYRKLASPPGVTLRPWDFSRLESETHLFHGLFDETFATHWGFGSMTEDEMSGLTLGLRQLLVPEFCWFAEVDGETAGFVYALPDLNQGDNILHGVLLVIGVRKQFRGRGVNTALGARSYLAMMDRGYESASYTVVLDDNWPSRRTAEKLGCRVERNFNVYRRNLV
jgi:hypothetical protein